MDNLSAWLTLCAVFFSAFVVASATVASI